MRIAFFTTRMMLGYGVDLTVNEIASRLVTRHGHAVDVWTPTSDGTYEGRPYALRELIVYGTPVNRVLPLLELNARTALRALARRLAKEGAPYDAVAPCTHPYYGAGQFLDTPSVFFNFGNVPTIGFTWKGRLNWAWLDFSETYLHKPRATRIVSISRFLHEQQRADAQRRGRIVHLGGDHYYPAPDGSRERLRVQLGLPADAILLGYCGRLHQAHPPYKGTREVLALGRRIRQLEPRVHLLLCGIGSERDEAWVREEGAIPLANLPPARMPEFYAALDAYVCASRWEGFNLPIVEAAWHGVPAVAYDAGAHGEHVTAVLVPHGDFDSLCRATLTLVRDPEVRRRLSADVRNKAQHFNWDRAASQFNAVLEEAAS